jgi:hypothetical protein
VNKIEDLRSIMFDTLRDLRDKEKPMDIERAKAVAEVAKVIVDSAKVEVDHMKITGGDGSGFIPDAGKKPALPAPGVPRLVKGRDTQGAD